MSAAEPARGDSVPPVRDRGALLVQLEQLSDEKVECILAARRRLRPTGSAEEPVDG